MWHVDPPSWRRRLRVLTLVGVAGLFAACGAPEDEGPTTLALLEWNGYQHPQFYPEYLEKYGQPPAFTFFDTAENAMKRMRTGYRVDLVHLCTGQLAPLQPN